MWNKALSFNLQTHCNVDKHIHAKLFIMQKLGVLPEYLLSLIEKDIQDNKSPVLDDNFCATLILNELGYYYNFNENDFLQFEKEAELLKSSFSQRNNLFEEVKKSSPTDFELINKEKINKNSEELEEKSDVEDENLNLQTPNNRNLLDEKIKQMNQELELDEDRNRAMEALV